MSDDWFDDNPTPATAPGEPDTAVALSIVATEPGEQDGDWFTAPLPVIEPTAPAAPARTARWREWRRPSFAMLGLGAAAVVTVLGAGAAIAVRLTAGPAPEPVPDAGTPAPVATTTTEPWCAGMGPGDAATPSSTDAGAAVIASFERAYFHDRDAGAARKFVAADARVGSAEELAAGIASIPAGTTGCVLVRKTSEGLYSVDLFSRAPNGALEQYRQTITTITAPAATPGALITGIVPREQK